MTRKQAEKRIVRELRSTSLKQGFGRLCQDGRHCALGILCEAAFAEGVLHKYKRGDMTFYTGMDGLEDHCFALPPLALSEWLGGIMVTGLHVSLHGAGVSGFQDLVSIVCANDGYKIPFATIADSLDFSGA